MTFEKYKNNNPPEDLRGRKILWTIDDPDISSDDEAEISPATDENIFPADDPTLLNTADQESFEGK